jgi:hypothetical protein
MALEVFMQAKNSPIDGNIFDDIANYVTSSIANVLESAEDAALGAAFGHKVSGTAFPIRPDVVRDGGIAAEVSLMSKFPGLQSMDTPEGMLNALETKLIPNLPESVPAGLVYNLLDRQGLPEKANAEIRATLDPKLMDDGKLSRPEMLKVLSDIGNKTDSVEPAAAIKKQAAGILARQNIDDPTGQLSTGLAKLAVSASVGMQRIENGAAPSTLIPETLQDRFRPAPSPG